MKKKTARGKVAPDTEYLGFGLLLGYPSFKLNGDRELIVNGVAAVNSYAEDRLELDLDKLQASIEGYGMRLVFLGKSTIKIEGKICSVALTRKGEEKQG